MFNLINDIHELSGRTPDECLNAKQSWWKTPLIALRYGNIVLLPTEEQTFLVWFSRSQATKWLFNYWDENPKQPKEMYFNEVLAYIN